MCLCVSLSASISPEPYAEIFTKIFMAVALSSSGVVAIAIRYVLPVLWMTSCFFYNGPYSGMYFATKNQCRLNYKDRQNSLSCY